MKSRSMRRLSVERFEDRTMMAGDVAVALEGSLLNIQGDDLANQVNVVQQANGNVVISGLAGTGTTINGLPSLTLVNPSLSALDVRMNGGNDTLIIRRLAVGTDMNIDMGAGNDIARVFDANVGVNASIKGESGFDRALISGGQFGGDVFIEQGIGASTSEVRNTSVGTNLTIIADDAMDTVRAHGPHDRR